MPLLLLPGRTVNILKFGALLFYYATKMLLINAGIHKILVRIGNHERLLQKQKTSLEAV